jgi:hypothetical protein
LKNVAKRKKEKTMQVIKESMMTLMQKKTKTKKIEIGMMKERRRRRR